MPQIRADMHCDALTSGLNAAQIAKKYLGGRGIMQCLAAFSQGNDAAAYASALDLFRKVCAEEGVCGVKNFTEWAKAQDKGMAVCALTCENIGFTDGEYSTVKRLKEDGVIMASLVWNDPNALAYPNVTKDGLRESRGLKIKGAEAVRALDECGIIVDISHLSDGGAAEILKDRKIPVVASHSNAAAICPHPRNLTDFLLKKTADCGGAVGINFYKKFLGNGESFALVAAHIKHIIAVAGEDAPAFGGDWEGVPKGGADISPADMPRLLNYLCDCGITPRAAEKAAYKNFLRVFCEVCPK